MTLRYITNPDGSIETVDDSQIEVVGVAQNKPKTTGSFNISNFIADIRTRGVVRSHSFMVNIVPPKILQDKWSDTRNILIRCDSATLPAANFQMGELYRHGYGPQESSPHNVQFEPVNLTYILDAQAEIYTFWYTWMNGIMNFNRSKNFNTADAKGKLPYEMAYKDDYATEIKILVYNESADAIIQTSLLEAFPMGLPEINLNWSSTDEIIRQNIPISYRDYYSQTVTPSVSDVGDLLSSAYPNVLPSKLKDSYRLLGMNLQQAATNKLDKLISDIFMK